MDLHLWDVGPDAGVGSNRIGIPLRRRLADDGQSEACVNNAETGGVVCVETDDAAAGILDKTAIDTHKQKNIVQVDAQEVGVVDGDGTVTDGQRLTCRL